MKEIHEGEVWFVNFPLEEDSNQTLKRPVVVLDVDNLNVLSVKVTKHEARDKDPYDTPIIYWEHAKLRFASTARISKVLNLSKENFIHKLGDLYQDDFDTISDMYIKFMTEQLG